MKPGLAIGDRASFTRAVRADETVPALFADATKFHEMPQVLATAYMVGLMEWGCVEQIAPFYDAGEGSLGVHVNVSHVAPTPPGLHVTVDSEITALEGRKIAFKVTLRDEGGVISEGTHERAVVAWDRFLPRIAEKAAQFGGGTG